MSEILLRTPLYDEHKRCGARLVPFAGWEMPVQYAGVSAEHMAVRTQAGLFDVSHMGEIRVQGPGARDYLDKLTVNDVSKLRIGQCQYSMLTHSEGGVVDDIIINRLADQDFFVVVNAAGRKSDYDWFQQHLPSSGVTLSDESDDWGLLAVQGPKALQIIQNFFGASSLPEKSFLIKEVFWNEKRLLISRTGYTGEDGVEIFVPTEVVVSLWRELLVKGADAGLVPCGLGARDTLRLEACYPLYGHELSSTISPLEAGLGWVVKMNKAVRFLGWDVLNKQLKDSPPRRSVCFEVMENAIARDGTIIFVGEERVGYVTSGTFSPLLKKPIGLALIHSSVSAVGQEIFLEIRGKKKKGKIVERPFYRRS